MVLNPEALRAHRPESSASPMSLVLYFIGLIDYKEIIWLQTFGVCPFNISLWQTSLVKKRKPTFQTDYHIPWYHTPKQPLHCALFSEEGVLQADMSPLPVLLNREFLEKLNFGNLSFPCLPILLHTHLQLPSSLEPWNLHSRKCIGALWCRFTQQHTTVL